jgi:chromosome segregation ATPase
VDLTVQLTDYCLKVNQDLTTLEQELAKQKKSNKAEHPNAAKDTEMCELEGEIGDLREAIAASAAKLEEDLITIEWRGNDCDRQSQAAQTCERQSGLSSKKKIARLWRQLKWTERRSSCGERSAG